MKVPLILHIDENHPLLVEGLEILGYKNIIAYKTPIKEVLKNLHHYSGMVIRSRLPVNKEFIDAEVTSIIMNIELGERNEKDIQSGVLKDFIIMLEKQSFEKKTYQTSANITD